MRKCNWVFLALLLVPTWAEAVEHSGRAFGVLVQVPSVATVRVVDTGELPPEGGTGEAFAVDAIATVPPESLTATTVACTTSAGGGMARSVAETQGLDLRLHVLLASARVTAALVRAEAEVACVVATGSSVLVDLQIDGTSIVVSGEPNQTVGIPGVATLIINEQVSTVDAASADLTVNALHVFLIDGAEVIVSGVHSDVHGCEPLAVSNRSWTGVKSLFR